jgi:CubicO group peptidase (beta-lactamase class C family)
VSETEIVSALEGFLDTLVGVDLFSGAVLVARDGTPIFKQAFGLASKAFDVPNRLDTKFNLGSMNKMFTAVAIAQLAERGRLSFSDPVGKHLPDYPSKQAAEKVTIHHLLTHTSGMGSYWNEKFEASKNRLRTVQDFIPLFADDALAFEPGEKFHYSNAGFIVLGAIVEAVSGQSYFDYVREQVYTPAGMHDTDAYEMDRDVPNLASGYTHTGVNGRPELGPRRNNLFLHVVKGGPAGGGFSTVEDLLRFDIALRAYTLLSPEYADIVLTGKVEVGAGPDVQYAYGFQGERVNGTRIVGHGGGFPGINGQLDMYLDLGYTVAVLSNYDPPAAGRVAKKLREMLT